MSLARNLAIIPLALLVVASAGCKPRGAKAIAEQEREANAQSSVAAMQQDRDEWKARYQKLADQKDLDKGGSVASSVGLEGIEGTSIVGGRVSLGEDFAFERGKATLNKEGKKAVEQLANKLNDGDNANQQVVVEGYTDDKPVSRPETIDRYTDNWGLSAARAASVVRALQQAGVKPERLHGAFRGQYAPAAGVGKDGAASRRVEIYLAK